MNELLSQMLPNEFPSYLREVISSPILLVLTIVSAMYLYYQFKRKAEQGDIQISSSVANIVLVIGVGLIVFIGL